MDTRPPLLVLVRYVVLDCLGANQYEVI